MIFQQTIFLTSIFVIGFAENHRYFKNGSKSELVCPIPQSTWTGPPNKEIYAVGMDVIANKTSMISVNNTDDASVLTFKEFVDHNAGFYECFDNKANFSYQVHIHKNPKNMSIMNEVDNGIIHIGDSETFVLKCSIIQGEPPSVLKWIHNAEIVILNQTHTLSYTINSSTEENGSVYTCKASDCDNKTLLSKTVTLSKRRLSLKPTSAKEESYTVSSNQEDNEKTPSTVNSNGYYAFLSIPGIAIIAFAIYFTFLNRGKKMPCEVTSCMKRDEQQEQFDIIDLGPGAIANDMYGHPLNPSTNRQNDEVQVYSSFDRRHNITLSTHAVSYSVRPKPRPDKTRKKKSQSKDKNVPTTYPRHSAAKDTETEEPQELNYVEVAFGTKKENPKLRIQRQHPKTDYVDIDFTKKLREPPDEENDNDGDEDFESAYELKKMKRRTNFQE